MKKFFIFGLMSLLVCFTSCKHEVDSVILIPDNITLQVGSTYQLKAVVKPEKAPQETNWASSNLAVATVSDNGLVTAIAEGTCEISVYADDEKAVCEVSVKAAASGGQPSDQKDSILSFTIKGVNFRMIYVKGSSFTMGATSDQGSDVYDNEKPAHKVVLSDYYIGQTEVTQALWAAVMESNPSFFRGNNFPIESVNWADCQDFIKKLGSLTGKKFRLPTEAEWEYAARGGVKSKWLKYSGSNNIDNVAWYGDNSNDQTHAVAQKQANELGLYDMSGNVWELCQDWYENYSSTEQTNPTGPTTGSMRVAHGGSYANTAASCRVARRLSVNPSDCGNTLGFRLVLVP